jgi:hypothetical protein
MKVVDILRTLANNLEHAQGGTPDPRIQNPAELIDVTVVGDDEQISPNGTTAIAITSSYTSICTSKST